MKHVFIETNWIVAHLAPSYHKLRAPGADALMARATAGELQLELPSICIAESRRALLTRYAPRGEADAIRRFLRWAALGGHITDAERNKSLTAVNALEREIGFALSHLDDRFAELRNVQGLTIFDVGAEAASLCSQLSFQDLNLNPYDQMILASVLTRAAELRSGGTEDLSFCELDSDLQPWGKNATIKQGLKALYDQAQIWVYGDFEMSSRRRPGDWLSTRPL